MENVDEGGDIEKDEGFQDSLFGEDIVGGEA